MAYKQKSPIIIAEGGTNTISFSNNNGTVYYDGTKLNNVDPGTSGWVLTSNGAAAPSFQAAAASGITTIDGNTGTITPTLGVVTISGDGTVLSTSGSGSTLSITSTAVRTISTSSGTATASSNGITFVGATGISTSATGSTVTITGTATSIDLAGNTGSISGSSFTISGTGVLSSNASGSTVLFTSTAANSISTSSGTATASANAFTVVGAGTISTSATGSTVTITGTGNGFSWVNVTGISQSMAVNTGYISNNASLSTFTLPATAAVGTVVAIQGSGAAGWSIAQNSGQTIHFNGGNSTTGIGGSVSSSGQYDSIELICNIADTDFIARNMVGNLSIV